VRYIIASLKDGRQTFERLGAPLAQDVGMHTIFSADLSERLFFFEQFQRNLSLEAAV
jgi:hypothetical protein